MMSYSIKPAPLSAPRNNAGRWRRGLSILLLLLFEAAVISCQTHSLNRSARASAALPGLMAPVGRADLNAQVAPPIGWIADPTKVNGSRVHQTWLSPSGDTAYGVVHFRLPLPVSANFILPFYINAWKADQGEATLLSKESDDALPGVRFAAEGGLYKTWSNLIVSGTEGWCVYAGVHRDAPVNESELADARRAREATRVGVE